MAAHSCTPAAPLRRRCWLISGLLLIVLCLITLGLWSASVKFLDLRLQNASNESSRQAIERLTGFIQSRLGVLRQVGHFVAHSENLQESAFLGFSSAVMADVPGIMAILVTDRGGNPSWIAPARALSQSALYVMVGDAKLKQALGRSLQTSQPALTEKLDVPEVGPGFMATVPILVGNRHVGYIIGVFHYKSLLDYMLRQELQTQYRIRINHGDWPVYPDLSGLGYWPRASARFHGFPNGFTQTVRLGGQQWDISVDPIHADAASATNFASMTILGLGLGLSLLLTYLVHRWQWKALLFQTQARDSQSRLERAGLSLADTKSELDLILNSVDEGIIFYNELLQPVQANAAFMMAFTLTENGEAMQSGHNHHEHMIQCLGSETKYWTLFNALRNNPEQTYTDELESPTGNPKDPVRLYLRRATTACGADGRARGVLVIYKDVTRIKAIDKVKDEFLANVTHELRSPLASIKGFAETIRRDQAMPPETRQEFITIICDESTRLQEQIEELLDLRRMEASGAPFKPVSYDLKELVSDLARNSRTILVSKNITIKIEWSGLFGNRLHGDVAQLNRALRNLLVNAVKYSPDGGEITITGHSGQRRLWLEIGDQGPGIGEQDLTHIFEKFYRGSRQGRQKGTGLGLAIVKHIIELHGGHLGVRSEVGHGTTFRIDLPRTYQPPVEEVETPPETEPETGTPTPEIVLGESPAAETGSS